MTDVWLRYFTDCDEATQRLVVGWTRTREFIDRMHTEEFYELVMLRRPEDQALDGGRYTWVIFGDGEPVGLLGASIEIHKWEMPERFSAPGFVPGDGPIGGFVTYIDIPSRGNGFAGEAKRLALEESALADVGEFYLVISEDNPGSLKAIAKTPFEYIGTEPRAGEPAQRHYRLCRS